MMLTVLIDNILVINKFNLSLHFLEKKMQETSQERACLVTSPIEV